MQQTLFPSSSLEQALPLSGTTNFDLKFLQTLLRLIDVRFKPLQDQKADLDEAINNLKTVALDRINDVLTPAIKSVLVIQERGFLTARSSTPGTFGDGNILTLFIDDLDERAVFVPSPYVALTRTANPDDVAIAKTSYYDRDLGKLVCKVLSYTGAPGPHHDWVIAAVAGSTIAQEMMLERGEQAEEGAVAARDAAVLAKLAAQQSAADAHAAQILIAGGPVISVNGKSGVVAGLALQDDVDALAASKADAANVYAKSLTNTKTEIASAIAAEVTHAKSFVASGAIAKGAFVALRTDGKVEAIGGTEVAASFGPSPAFAGNFVATLDASYHAASGRVAVLYYTGTALAVRIGQVTGNVISFGAPLTLTGLTIGNNPSRIVWKSDGTSVAIAAPRTGAASLYQIFCTVSGTTMSAQITTPITSTGSAPSIYLLTWDAATDRVIIAFDSTSPRMVALSITSGVVTLGAVTSASLTVASVVYYHSAANRLIFIGPGGVTNWTLSNLTWTSGGFSTFSETFSVISGSAKLANGTVLVFGSLSASLSKVVCAITFGGVNPAIGASAIVYGPNTLMNSVSPTFTLHYSPADDKCVVQALPGSTSSPIRGPMFWTVSVAGNVCTVSLPVRPPDIYGIGASGFTLDGTFVAYADLYSMAGETRLVSARIIDGNLFFQSVTYPIPATTVVNVWLMLPGSIIEFAIPTGGMNTATFFTVPSFSGFANRWLGVARATVADGATVKVRTRSAIIDGLSGLTINQQYYLSWTGALTTVDNGIPAGVALSATELRLSA